MGCAASKLDNEDTVRRCKERRRLMKESVYARHHLAAAHADYCRSLRLTGSALSSFAAGEPLSVSDHTPAVLLRTPSSVSHATPVIPPPPPPRVPSPSPSSFSRATTLPPQRQQQQQPPQPPPPLQRRRKPSMKLPHILSESSLSPNSSPQSHNPHRSNSYREPFTYNANTNYTSTPSQASSVWNWENFYPPSPPSSEYFQQRNNNNNNDDDDDKASSFSRYRRNNDDDDKASIYSGYRRNNDDDDKASNFSGYRRNNDDDKASIYSGNRRDNDEDKASNYSGYRNHSKHRHADVDETGEETEREEVQCSEWDDDHYSTTSSSDVEYGDRDSRSEIGTRSNFESSVHNEPKAPPPAPAAASKFSSMSKSEKSDDAGSSVSWNPSNGEFSDMKMVVRHRDLAEIVAAIKEYFDKAASSGEKASELLETGRAQLDRSFRQLKKTVYHSSGVFSNLSSSWTSKPPLAVKYRFEPAPIDEPGGPKSLCSTLERLLAWEKKLYQEVKAREGVKIEHEKKLSALQSQECRGDVAKLDKTKASIQRLQSLIVVTSQAVSTTSSAIIDLRDSELVPQLVELCHGFMYMWRSMNQFHEVQNHIVQQVRGLVNRSAKGEATSDLHRQATRDLESVVSTWHASFCRLIKFQRDFIRSLHGWFKLTSFPLNNNEQTITNREISEVFAFCDEWKLALDQLPDTVASEAIKSFINVVHAISLKQTEEMKIKKRTESASKELDKKASSLRNIEKKFYHSYSMVGISLPDTGPENRHALDARDPLAEKKSELMASQRRVEDEMLRHSKAVEVTRAMTLNNIQTGLPGVFQAMTSFSALIMEALETVCTRSYAIK